MLNPLDDMIQSIENDLTNEPLSLEQNQTLTLVLKKLEALKEKGEANRTTKDMKRVRKLSKLL